MSKYNLDMVRGDTLAFGFELENITDVDTAHFSVKKAVTDTEYVFQKTIGNGIEKVEDGKYSVRVAPSDTHDLEIGAYYFDLQIGVNGDIFTILNGKLNIEADITREG